MSSNSQGTSPQPSHQEVLSKITGDVRIPDSVPEPTPAKKPDTKSSGCVIFGEGKSRSYTSLPKGYFPLYPVRFSVNDDFLATITTYIQPKKINTPSPFLDEDNFQDRYDLVPIRQGYIYVYYYQSDSWSVFRYKTTFGDRNSIQGRDDVNETAPTPDYSFTKIIKSESNTWEQDIKSEDKGSYPYIPIKEESGEAIIGYSEFLWPDVFFKEALTEVFIKNFMQKIDTNSQKSQNIKPIDDVLNYPGTFNEEKNQEPGNLDKAISNYLRYTNRSSQGINNIFRTCDELADGFFIAFNDEPGDLMDIHLCSVHLFNLAEDFEAKYQYPLTIGRIVQGLVEREAVSDSQRINLTNPSDGGIFTAELSKDFNENFQPLQQRIDRIKNKIDLSISNSVAYLNRTGIDSFNTVLGYYQDLISKYPHEDQIDIAQFSNAIASRYHEGLQDSFQGKEFLFAVFSGDMPKREKGDEVMYADISTVQSASLFFKQVKILEGFYVTVAHKEGIQKELYNATRFMMSVLSDTLARAHFKLKKSPIKNIVQSLFSIHLKQIVETISEVRDKFLDIFSSTSGTSKAAMTSVVDEHLSKQNSAKSKPKPHFEKPLKMNFFKYIGKFNLSDTDLYKSYKNLPIAEYTANHLGWLGGALTVWANAQNVELDDYSDLKNTDFSNMNSEGFIAFTQNPLIQISGGLVDIIAAYSAFLKPDNAVLHTSKFLDKMSLGTKRLFPFISDSIINSTRYFIQGKLLPDKLVVGTAKVLQRAIGSFAGIVTAALATGSAMDSYQKRDIYGVIANSLWACSGILFAAGLIGGVAAGSWIFIIGALALAVGFVVNLFSRDEIQLWVWSGLWGTSEKFLGDDRLEVSNYIKNIQGPTPDKDDEKYEDFIFLREKLNEQYLAELNRFILLTTTIDIQDETQQDRSFELYSSIFEMKNYWEHITIWIEEVLLRGGPGSGPDSRRFIGRIENELESEHIKITKDGKAKVTVKTNLLPYSYKSYSYGPPSHYLRITVFFKNRKMNLDKKSIKDIKIENF
jgi:hypothetical protein